MRLLEAFMKSRPRSMVEETLPEAVAPFVEKRKERRYPTNDAVLLKILPNEKSISAIAVDVSRSGIRLALGQGLSTGAKIEIFLPASQVTIVGEVRYCRRSDATFYAGVRIEEFVSAKYRAAQHLKQQEVLFYIEGKGLKRGERLRIEDHVLTCASCAKRVSELTRAVQQRRLPPQGDTA
ncbi:MAG TPA: PilZ domain-containing protein [Bryobacteraceae bacterium]|nr:PilZ domain-containing protein [Bryobacteraceae bacterium]